MSDAKVNVNLVFKVMNTLFVFTLDLPDWKRSGVDVIGTVGVVGTVGVLGVVGAVGVVGVGVLDLQTDGCP